jgi:hypothetical protein
MRVFERIALVLACALLAFWHVAARAQPAPYGRDPRSDEVQVEPQHGASRRAQRAQEAEILRNGPPSPAAQMQQQMPLAKKRGNGDPSPARQMQLKQGASHYAPAAEPQRKPFGRSR